MGFCIIDVNPPGPLHDHDIASPPVSVKSTSSPSHTGPPLSAEHTGNAFTTTIASSVTSQPFASVTVTVYIVIAVGLAVTVAVVPSPLDHKNV